MFKFKMIIVFLVLVANFIITKAQDNADNTGEKFQDELLEKLIGQWSVTGKIGNENIAYNFSAKWSLEHQFCEISLIDTAQEPKYTANVFIGYVQADNKYIAHWLDNFGGDFSKTLGYGTRKGDTIEFLFEYPSGPFINQFIYNKQNNTWNFHSKSRNGGNKWETFGDIYLHRTKLSIPDGFYIVRRKEIDAFEFSSLNKGESVININNEFLDFGTSLLVIDTTDYVPLLLEEQPQAQQQTPEKKLLQLSLSKTSTKRLEDFTRKNIMKRVTIVIDGEAYTVHKIREAIIGGKIQITRCSDNACERLFIHLKDNLNK